jgi:hypothetical protein
VRVNSIRTFVVVFEAVPIRAHGHLSICGLVIDPTWDLRPVVRDVERRFDAARCTAFRM